MLTEMLSLDLLKAATTENDYLEMSTQLKAELLEKWNCFL